MCKGFGMIITKTLEGFFCEPDGDGNCSHSEVLRKLGWEDNENQFLRNFVRVQCPDWTIESFEFDEEDTLPGWAEENRDQIINLVNNTLEKVYPVLDEFHKTIAQKWVKFNEKSNLAWSEYNSYWNMKKKEIENFYDMKRTKYTNVLELAAQKYCKKDESEFLLNKYTKICSYIKNKCSKLDALKWKEWNKIEKIESGKTYDICDKYSLEYNEFYYKKLEQMITNISNIKGYVIEP